MPRGLVFLRDGREVALLFLRGGKYTLNVRLGNGRGSVRMYGGHGNGMLALWCSRLISLEDERLGYLLSGDIVVEF
jgi:hypothetical protein